VNNLFFSLFDLPPDNEPQKLDVSGFDVGKILALDVIIAGPIYCDALTLCAKTIRGR
jgi:hypothetical protein